MLSVSLHKKLRDQIERQYSVPLESYEANAKSSGTLRY
jgi:hypothetical protein